jgi:transposase
MSTERYKPEFQEEAVRQVVERGYAMFKVATQLGGATHSLYKWVKAVTPCKNGKQSAELLEAKNEISA